MRKPLTFTLLLILTLLLTLPALAQTPRPEPTLAPTPEAAASDEPTAEAEVTPEATPADAIVIDTGDGGSVTIPVDEAPEPEQGSVRLSMLEFALWSAGLLLTGVVTAGGLAGYIMRDPSRVAVLEKLGDSVPKEHADRVVGIVEIFVPILTLVREVFDHLPYADKNIEGQITAAFDNERAKQRENANAQLINRGLNIEPQNVTPLPPMEPLNG